MKKVQEASIGRVNFAMEEDAYYMLKDYLLRFETTIKNKEDAKEVMEDVETRVAEIFVKEREFSSQVIDRKMVQSVINHLGEVGYSSASTTNTTSRESEDERDTENQSQTMGNSSTGSTFTRGEKRLMRDVDNKMLGGVCSGMAAYFDVDISLMRILFVLFFCFGFGGFTYIILWIVMPKALTVSQKLQMRGYEPTADNIMRYTTLYKN